MELLKIDSENNVKKINNDHPRAHFITFYTSSAVITF